MSGRLSVLILTLNEERNIVDCLESVRWADEIVVLDSGSSDRTADLARRYTNRVIQTEWKGYGSTRNAGLEMVTGEWVLWLDADERVTAGLAAEILRLLSATPESVSAYRIARRAYFLGRWIRHCGWYPSRAVRLFRRARGRFTETAVHERLLVEGEIGETTHDILHFTDPDLHHYLTKFNRYTTLAAEDLQEGGRRFGLSDVLFRPVFTFLKMYLLRRGFLDGMPGFILCVLSSTYVFVKYAKFWEIQRSTQAEKGE